MTLTKSLVIVFKYADPFADGTIIFCLQLPPAQTGLRYPQAPKDT